MKNARKFILDHGGIEKAQMMTKYKLAVFGQYEWQLVNYIPLFLFKKGFPLYSYGYIKGISQQIQITSPSGSILISFHWLTSDITKQYSQCRRCASAS
jgi:hypothetical protein